MQILRKGNADGGVMRMEKAKKIKISVAAIVTIILTCTICYNYQQNKYNSAAKELFDLAEKYYYYEYYPKAKEVYVQLVQSYPDSTYAIQAKELLSNYEANVEKSKQENIAERERKAKEEIANKEREAKEAAERQEREAREKAEAEEKRRQHEEAIKPPLQLIRGTMERNAINNPMAGVIVKNISDKIIDAYTVKIHCYNNYGDPVKQYGYDSNVYGGISQERIYPGREDGYNTFWTLYGHENTTKVEIVLVKVHCTDGTLWTPEAGQRVFVKANL